MEENPIAIIGGGPAGMAAALALLKTGRQVRIYERYREARPAGVILNLWPPPIRALQEMGVDVEDLGAPCRGTFHNAEGHLRAAYRLPQEVVDKYGGGFIGLLRPDLYRRMIAAIPDGVFEFNRSVSKITDIGGSVELEFEDGATSTTPLVIGADGIDSFVRKTLWGDAPKRAHNLQVFGGYTLEDIPNAIRNEMVISHGAEIQASYSQIRTQGRDGFQWWTTEPWEDQAPPPEDIKAHALEVASEVKSAVSDVIRATPMENFQRWMIRDRAPLTEWSKGRVTLTGDAAHPTSPYAAYGAGMAIGDGYFLAKILRDVDLSDNAAVASALQMFDSVRIPHTTVVVESAYQQGMQFHHTPEAERAERDRILDETDFLQDLVGDRLVAEIIAQLDEMGADVLAPSDQPVSG